MFYIDILKNNYLAFEMKLNITFIVPLDNQLRACSFFLTIKVNLSNLYFVSVARSHSSYLHVINGQKVITRTF